VTTSLLRKAAAGVLLALPAALLAHAIAFGHDHAAGGRLHALFLELAGVSGFFATLAIAVRAQRRMRLTRASVLWIAVPAVAWFSGIEAVEARHGIPHALSLAAIFAASWLVRAIVRAFAQTLVAVAALLWSRVRAPQFRAQRASRNAWLPALRPAYRFRIFSRPPPRFLNA